MQARSQTLRIVLPFGAVALWTALYAGVVVPGSDLMWVVSFGDVMRDTGRVPAQVPNVVGPQVDWANPVLLAQLLLSYVNSWGWAGLPAWNLLLVAASLTVVVVDGVLGGASGPRLAVAVSLLAVGAAATFGVMRFPMLSLVPFVLLVALLRDWDRRHGRAIWAVPPLMVLWGNLHGAVLVGLAVLGVFLVAAGRRGARTRVAVGLLSLACLVLTSAGLRTPEYYVTALGNEAAVRGSDLWARPSLSNPLDVAMIVAALVLVVMARSTLPVWEWLVVAGLALATLSAARHGVWLLMFLAPRAGVPRAATTSSAAEGPPVTPGRRVVTALLALTVVLASAVTLQLAGRADEVRPPGLALVPPVSLLAGHGTVLAVEPEAETFAQRGVQVWAANPIDALTRRAQSDFLDFLHDCQVPKTELRVVVVQARCVQRVQAQGWSIAERQGELTLLTRAVDADRSG